MILNCYYMFLSFYYLENESKTSLLQSHYSVDKESPQFWELTLITVYICSIHFHSVVAIFWNWGNKIWNIFLILKKNKIFLKRRNKKNISYSWFFFSNFENINNLMRASINLQGVKRKFIIWCWLRVFLSLHGKII